LDQQAAVHQNTANDVVVEKPIRFMAKESLSLLQESANSCEKRKSVARCSVSLVRLKRFTMIPIPELGVLAEARTMISDPDPNDPNNSQPTDAESLLPIVYDELRRLAAARLEHETLDQTLQATALVHEAYIRLTVGSSGPFFCRCRRVHASNFD
jgi:ECF sigma factor